MAAANYARQLSFLHSLIDVAISAGRPYLSHGIIKALNFHAIVGLHHEAGKYRSSEVVVGDYRPPPSYEVEPLMDDLVNQINWAGAAAASVHLATYALWRINHVHPFVNGNGRTARAVCYFLLCVKEGGPLPGTPILPHLLTMPANRDRYVEALKAFDEGDGNLLIHLISELRAQQLRSAQP